MKKYYGLWLMVIVLLLMSIVPGCSKDNGKSGSENDLQQSVSTPSQDSQSNNKPANIEIQAILDDFKDVSDNDIPKGTLGGTFYPANIFIPKGFKGAEGETFYVSLEDGHVMLVQEYQIYAAEGNVLKYKIVNSSDEGDPPKGDYDKYSLVKDEWQIRNR